MNVILIMFTKIHAVKKKTTNVIQFKNSKHTANMIYNFVARILILVLLALLEYFFSQNGDVN